MNRYDDIEEVTVAKTFGEIRKFNPFHDSLGRFSSSRGMRTFSANPKTRAGAMAIERSATAGYGHVMNVHRESVHETIGQNDTWLKTGQKPSFFNNPKVMAAINRQNQPKTTAKPKDSTKPQNFKKLTNDDAKDMAKKMGQDPSQIGDEDVKQMNSHNWKGYFGTGNSFEINKNLRDGKKLSDDDKKTVEALDRNMKPSTESVKLNRMVDNSFFDSLGIDESNYQAAEGKVYANKGYSSTSYDMKANVFKSRNVQLNINAPKGTKMLVSTRRDWDGNPDEAEILLARNTAMKITGIKKVGSGWGTSYEVDCEVIVLD